MTQTRILLAVLILPVFAAGCTKAGGPDAPSHAGQGAAPRTEEHPGLELTPEQIAAAGIRTVAAGPGQIKTVLTLSAVVSENLDAQAHVNPRAPGLVRTVQAHLGKEVKAGEPLCVIDSVDFGQAVSEYLKARAMLKTSETTLRRERELLDRAVALASTVLERERTLSEREITTRRFFFEADRAMRDAELRRDSRVLELEGRIEARRIELTAARTRLLILGVPPDELENLDATPAGTEGRYVIRAPRAGIIVARHITDGEFVDAQTKLFEIQDLSTVWVLASIYEQDLALAREGAPATVFLNAFPQTAFEGEVDFIDFHVDPATRAASIRILIENKPIPSWNEGYPVRPGLFGRVDITVDSRRASLVIPEDALVHEGDSDFAFVRTGSGSFEQRSVQVSAEAQGMVEVFSGLASGEEVVVAGTFQLKSFLRKGELGEGHAH